MGCWARVLPTGCCRPGVTSKGTRKYELLAQNAARPILRHFATRYLALSLVGARPTASVTFPCHVQPTLPRYVLSPLTGADLMTEAGFRYLRGATHLPSAPQSSHTLLSILFPRLWNKRNAGPWSHFRPKGSISGSSIWTQKFSLRRL